MSDQTLFDATEYQRLDSPWGSGPMPLWMFDAEKRAEIEEAVSRPKPPPKWLNIGPCAEIISRAWVEWHRARGGDPLCGNPRESIARWLRAAVLDRDGYVCQLCGEPVEPTDVHLDHRLPVSRGGKNTLDNLQVAHSFCNLSKGARLPAEGMA